MIIHQVLHGYSQGHNRLASSFPLSVQDDDKMKMLSDWSEYSGIKDNSYITTYPLLDGRHYVVAKSWYADDMERPGCVWTHSLILDLNNLDEKFDFRSLMRLFKRPIKGDYSSYSEVIRYTAFPLSGVTKTFQEDVLVWLYSNLIENKGPMVYRVEQDSSYYQGLILLLLQYLPLGFCKNVVLCSGSAYGRKSSMVEYTLQFATSVGTSLFTVVKDSKNEIDGVCEGIRSICETMIKDASDTSEVLRVFSSDIGSSPLKLCTTGTLLKYLDNAIAQSGEKPSFSEIVKLMVEAFPSMYEGINVKTTFCKKSVSNLFSPELVVLADLATCISDKFLNYDAIEYHQRVADLKNSEGVDAYAKYILSLLESDSINSAGEYQLKNSSEYLQAGEYYYLANNYWSVYMSLVIANPNILRYSFWVDLPEGHFASVYDLFRKYCFQDFDNWGKLFQIVLYRHHTIDTSLMECFVKNIPNFVWEVMEYLNHSVAYQLDPLVKRYCTDKSFQVLEWLREQKELTMPTARFIVENLSPYETNIKAYGSNIWTSLYNCNQYETLQYFTFMYILGHNWSDNIGLKYIKRSFFQLHQALATDSLPIYLWAELEPYTAQLRWYNEWDKCKKLRKGIVKYLKSSGYGKDVLFDFTPFKNLNETLEGIWSRS